MTTLNYRNHASYGATAKEFIMDDLYEQTNRKEQKREMKRKKYAKNFSDCADQRSDNHLISRSIRYSGYLSYILSI